jgi:hypothetical protein
MGVASHQARAVESWFETVAKAATFLLIFDFFNAA